MERKFSPTALAQQTSRRRKHRGNLRFFMRLMLVVAILLCLYAMIVNWRQIAPDSAVAWVEDAVSGTADDGTWPVEMTGESVGDMQEVAGNLVLLTDTATVYYNGSGGESVRHTCAYARPLMKVSDRYVLLLETGGKRFRLETRSGIELEQSIGNVIYTGAVSQKGDVAVVTDSSQSYVSEVTVFSRRGTQRYQWLSSEWLVMDASFSKDGNSLAVVASRSQNGAMQSAILVFDLRGREEQPVQYTADGTLYTAVQYMSGGNLVAVGDTQTRFVNPTGKLDEIVSHEGVELIGFAIDGNDVAVVTRPYGSQKGGDVSLYSPSGDLRVAQAFEGSFRDACPFGKKVLVLTNEYVYDINAGGIARQVEAENDSRMVGAINGKAVLLQLTKLDTVDFNPKPTETTAVTTTTAAVTMP
ncbi:MAG: hypothetical protein IJC52_06175 [Clostridia bacterium]|nr:hypothetical protein [Clostridia bacterium]